jgi:hypothetical protein
MATRDDAPRTIDLEALRSEGKGEQRGVSIAVLDTSEVRWFALGSPAPEVVDWFAGRGHAGTLEDRCDVYQLHRLQDIGVKRRSRDKLEVKVRRAIGETLALQPGLAAPFEEWRKWSPHDSDPMAPSPDAPWIDIHKSVLTRTFMRVAGEVVGPAPHIDDTLSGCDVEVVAVTFAGVESWSFAFEAFGPKADRRRAVTESWSALINESGPFENLGSYFDQPAGYPEWLALTASKSDEAAPAGSLDRLTG